MRLTMLIAALALLVPATGAAQGTSSATQPAQAAAQAQTQALPAAESPRANALPVKRVVLYKNGVGYFEHLGRVRGNQSVTVDFTSSQLDDALMSLTTLDLGGGRITGINYNSEAPLSQQLSALGLPIGTVDSVAAFLGALRGARLEARTPGGVFAGRLLAVEKRAVTSAGRETQLIDQLSIVTDGGEVRIVELSPAVSIRLADRDLNQQVGRYLSVIASGLQESMRRMSISTAGSGERPLFVSYVSVVPVWKTTYRLVIPSKPGSKPFLQGWAIVDNTIGEDWTNVEMSLVAGAPQSFIQQISQPYYVSRPVVPLPASVLLAPQTHEAGLTGGTGTLTGRVTDAQGGVLPGVRVRAIRGGNAAAGAATTDGRGAYEITVLPGRYQLQFELSGFRTVRLGDVDVTPGARIDQNATMEVGSAQETVQVTGATSVVTGRTMVPETGVAGGVVGGMVGALPEASFRAIQPAATGRELGDLFEYRIKEPVTIRKNQSAMVPILNNDVALEKVTIWQPGGANAIPRRAVWLDNSTGLTLDGGSFTVLEADAFAGEGLTESIKPGEKRLLSYAADTAIHVDAKTDGGPRRIERVQIARGVIIQSVQDRERRVYTVRNEDAAARTVIVEHPARPGWVLAKGSPQPAETTADFLRFRLTVEPKKTATLAVEETHPRDVRITLSTMTDDQLTLFLRGPDVTDAVQAALRPIVEKKQAIAAIGRDLAARKAEADRIAADQQRVRENMKALKGSAEEKALTQRYARQLDEQENRLEVLRKETADLERQRTAAQAELDKLISTLTLDVTI